MPRYSALTRRRFLQLSGAGLAGAAVSRSVGAVEDERAVFVHPATSVADVAAAVRERGGSVTYEYATLDFVAARIPADRREALERDRRVGGLERDDEIGPGDTKGPGRGNRGTDDGDAGTGAAALRRRSKPAA